MMAAPGVCQTILDARNKPNSYGSSSKHELFNQDYQQLKEYCITHGVRYLDERFPPDKISIGGGILSPSDLARVVWLRPAVSVLGGLNGGTQKVSMY